MDEKKESTKNWYALYTKPRAEKKLKNSLDKQKISNFLPIISIKKKWSDRIKIIDMPLFSSYIFVNINYAEESLRVLKDPNSVQFVFFQGKPAIMQNEEIELLQLFIQEFPEKIKVEEINQFQVGKEISIQFGPFKGRKGIIERVKNSSYLVINIPMLGKKVKVEIKKEDIEPVQTF